MTKREDDNKLYSFIFDRDAKVKIHVAKIEKIRYCECPGGIGKISHDPFEHEPDCRFRKKIRTGKYSIDTELSLDKIHDGYNLGIALTDD